MTTLKKGDLPGHEFRGNQHTGGGSSTKPIKLKKGVKLLDDDTISYKGQNIGQVYSKYGGKFKIKYADGKYSSSSYSSKEKAANHAIHHYKKSISMAQDDDSWKHKPAQQPAQQQQTSKPNTSNFMSASEYKHALEKIPAPNKVDISSVKALEAPDKRDIAKGNDREVEAIKGAMKGLHPQKSLEIISGKSGVPMKLLDDLTAGWNSSSKGSFGMNMQLAAGRVLGATVSDFHKTKYDNNEHAYDIGVPDNALDAAMVAIYDFTQSKLKDAGVKEITLYRGLGGSQLSSSDVGERVDATCNALESWTSSKDTATDWSSHAVAAKVPIERVFSMHKIGPGSFGAEHEYIVINSGVNEVLVIK